jgi:hypothetical protein
MLLPDVSAGYACAMEEERKTRRLKLADIVFGIYLASFGVLTWADDQGMLARPPSKFVTVPYAPLIWFYKQVTWILK